MTMTSLRNALLAASAMVVMGAAQANQPTWVIGQSLPMTGPSFPIANRVLAGTRAAIERVNAAGGIQGRQLELVTLDDAGDPQRVAENVKRLARQHGVVAVLNCLGERACTAAAQSAATEDLPLVGPFSGDPALEDAASRRVFMLRVNHLREAMALYKQLQTMSITRVALWGDGEEPLREQALFATLTGGNIEVVRVQGTGSAPPATTGAQALVLSLGPRTLDDLSRSTTTHNWPTLIFSTSNIGLTQATRLWRDRALGFTFVVPNPEASQLPLVRDFDRLLEQNGSPEALSFEGLSAFIHTQVVIEGLRNLSAAKGGAKDLPAALERIGTLNLGGYVLQLNKSRRETTGFVEFGVRSRDGKSRR